MDDIFQNIEPAEDTPWLYYLFLDDSGYIMSSSYQPKGSRSKLETLSAPMQLPLKMYQKTN